MRADLRAQSADAEFEPALTSAENAFSVRMLSASFDQSVKNLVDADTVARLESAAALLPETEERLPEQALADARSAVEGVRATIESAELPTEILDFLRRQVSYMERGIREYPIVGATAFRDASDEAAADWLRSAETIRPYENSAPMQDVRTLWANLQARAQRVIIIGSALGMLWKGGIIAGHLAYGLHVVPAAAEQMLKQFLEIESGVSSPGPELLPGSHERPEETT